jgi:proliferating cell nuclear antigen
MRLYLKDAALLKRGVDSFHNILMSVNLNFTAEGLKVMGMDAAHVMFVDYKLSQADCNEYSCEDEVIIGIQTVQLHKVLSTIQSGDSLTLENIDDKLRITLRNETTKNTSTYDISTIEISEDAIAIPEIEYPAKIKMKTREFHQVFRNFKDFGEVMRIELSENGLELSTEGFAGHAKQTFDPTDDREMELALDSVITRAPIQYIDRILHGAGSLNQNVEYSFGPGVPMSLLFHFGGNSYFNGYVAPKIDEED